MASFQQVNYCKNCKTNVSVNEKGQCKLCNYTQLNRTWSVRFRIMCLDGEKHKRLSGFKTKKEADIAYSKFITSYSIQNETKNNNSFIYEEMLKKYLNSCKVNDAPSTLYDKQKNFDIYITPFFHGKDVSKISKSELLDWQNELWQIKSKRTNQTLSWNYKVNIRSCLYNFLSFCEEMYNIPNKFRTIRRPKNQEIKKEIEFWEIQEFNNFINSIDDILWKTLWLTFMFTGARFNEVRAFSDNDIGEVTRINKALSGKKSGNTIKATKNYKCFEKQTPDVLKLAIEKYKQFKLTNNISNKYLFGGNTYLSEKIIRYRLDNDINKYNSLHPIKLKRITPHGFRHSYVSMLIHSGISTKIVAELIGDREEQVIQTYGHLYKNAKNNAIDILNKNLGTFLGTN